MARWQRPRSSGSRIRSRGNPSSPTSSSRKGKRDRTPSRRSCRNTCGRRSEPSRSRTTSILRRNSRAGRALLVLGAALLLVSLFGNLVFPSTYVTWFTLSGNQPQLPAGAYTGIQVTELLNTLVSGPSLWIAFGCLLVSAAAAIAIGGIGERTRPFGTFGVLVLLLYAGLLYVAADQYNQHAPAGKATVAIGDRFLTPSA